MVWFPCDINNNALNENKNRIRSTEHYFPACVVDVE